MATQYIHKFDSLTRIGNKPTASGIGSYNGRLYANLNGNIAPLSGPWYGNVLLVDADNGSDTDTRLPYATIQAAVTAASAGDTIVVRPRAMSAGATDPVNYAETIVIPAGKSRLRIVGDQNGVAQGAQPQIKKGSGSTALLTVRSPGCFIGGLSFNGGSSTGGGILLDDDASTKSAFGTIIAECFFKNCAGSGAAATGGAIMWASTGGAWQSRVVASKFFNNLGGIVLLGTSNDRPKDVTIDGCEFGSDANTAIDCDIYLAAGSGMVGLAIKNCNFNTVDVPAYASTPTAARYLDLTNCDGAIDNCSFACVVDPAGTEKTFGASGTAVKIPTTVRMSRLWGEGVAATADMSVAGRT